MMALGSMVDYGVKLSGGCNISCQQSLRQNNPVVLPLVFALAYAVFLTSLPLDVFSDRVNYLNYAENSWNILEHYFTAGPLVAIFNEPLWLLINAGLAKLFPPEVVLRLIIFSPAFMTAWFVLRYDSKQVVWLLLFLLLPQVVGYHITGLRQGMAIAVFLAGWFSCRVSLRWLLLATTPFIHASFFFVLLLLGFTKLLRSLRFAGDLRTLFFIMLGIVISSSLSFIAVLTGARQSGVYEFTMTNVSGFGVLFWLLIFIIMVMQGRTFMRRHAFEMGCILFYLSTYFLIEVTARIFESALLLVLLSCLQLTGWRRFSFLALICSYFTLQYLTRLQAPLLGFGFH